MSFTSSYLHSIGNLFECLKYFSLAQAILFKISAPTGHNTINCPKEFEANECNSFEYCGFKNLEFLQRSGYFTKY